VRRLEQDRLLVFAAPGAVKNMPVIARDFLDDLDAVGRHRSFLGGDNMIVVTIFQACDVVCYACPSTL
jgi:hypothetical protein